MLSNLYFLMSVVFFFLTSQLNFPKRRQKLNNLT